MGFFLYFYQVDCVIDQCSNPYNIRTAALDAKKKLESIEEDYVIDVSIVS